MPLGASTRKSPAKRLGATPYARLNARVNASSEEYPAPKAASVAACPSRQLVRGALEQQSAAERGGRLAQDRRRHAVEMEAAQVRTPRELGAGGRVVDVDQDVDDAAKPIFHPGSSSLAESAPA